MAKGGPVPVAVNIFLLWLKVMLGSLVQIGHVAEQPCCTMAARLLRHTAQSLLFSTRE